MSRTSRPATREGERNAAPKGGGRAGGPPVRVVVFGGTGFVGRNLAGRLSGEGRWVRAAARGEPAGSLPADEFRACDILDEAGVADCVRGADAVVNLVGIVRERRGHTYESVHVDGARRIARAARAAGVPRLVQVSALGVGRHAPSRADRSKRDGESAVLEAFPGAVIVRPSLVFGPGDHFVARFAPMVRKAPVVPLIGDGRTRFQPLSIDDMVAGLGALLTAPDVGGRIYEFGGPRTYSFRELLLHLGDAVGRRPRFLPLSFGLAEALARATGWLPFAPLTVDEVRLLETDKTVAPNAFTLVRLGIHPAGFEERLPHSLPPSLRMD